MAQPTPTAESMFESMRHDVGPVVVEELEVADLSRTCRRDRFCGMCVRAYCSHCCGDHHSLRCFDDIIPVPLDAAGRPAFPTCYPGSADPIPPFVAELMAAEDYTTPLRTDSYCLACMVAFCSGSDSCYHHRRICWCRC
jgi:hypothetical protein